MDETTNMKLKKPVENEYISIEIINENMDIIDTGMKEISDSVDAPVFDDSGSVVGITNKTTLLASFVSKMPLVKFLRNVKAGFKLVSFVGDIVNNCVTDNANLPLSAAQGKVLMDLYTVLNTKSVPYALNGQYIYNYIAAHYTYQNNVVGVIPICVKEGSTITVNNVQACLTGSSAYYDVTKNVISFERQNDYCIGIALELSNAYANTALRVTFTVSP